MERNDTNWKNSPVFHTSLYTPRGEKRWYSTEGALHEGPAIQRPKGNDSWYLNGKELPEKLFLKLTGDIKELPLHMGKGFDDFIAERIKT